MCKSIFKICSFIVLINAIPLFADGWGQPPEGWDDFMVGLVNDHKDVFEIPMNEALAAGIRIDYRYTYINGGVDPATNAISWLFADWYDYVDETPEGMSPAFVIYMLQEEGGVTTLKQNANNSNYMKSYFNSVKIVAENANGTKAIFVLEPDTWGYALQSDQSGAGANVLSQPACINNLGNSWLSGFDNKIDDITEATIATIREFAPDAYVGVLMNFWSVDANGATGDPVPEGIKGMVWWNIGDIEYSANKHVEFLTNMLDKDDIGDFIAVEKKGLDAGFYLEETGTDAWYWDDPKMEKYLHWVKIIAQGVDLPVLGWQISIAHMGLPNVPDRYEDTFMPYFFTHVNDFLQTGFIGFLVGEGLPQGTNYSMKQGEGDDGWFFQHLDDFNQERPYNLNITTQIESQYNKKNVAKNTFLVNVYSSSSNPVITLDINVGQKNSNLSVELFNPKGKKIDILFNGKVDNQETVLIDKTRFSAGVYFVKVKAGNITKTTTIPTLY